MKNYDEFINKKIDRLTIKSFFAKNWETYCNCICDCGTEKIIRFKSIKDGKTHSCGCLYRESRKHCHKANDLTGKRFGKFIVIGRSISKSKKIYWKCKCDCGIETNIADTHLKDKGKYKKCICSSKIINVGKFNLYISRLKNHNVDITSEDLYNLWTSQNGICPYTGIKLKLKSRNTEVKETDGIFSASLDRIDSNKGYEKGNIQFVSMMMNFAKNKFSNEHVIQLCKIIANHWKDKI